MPSHDLEDRTLGVGEPTSSDRSSGKHRARWSTIDLTVPGGGPTAPAVREYDVPHDLQEVPTLCTLETFSNPQNAATFISATEARRENWSHSHCHVSIRLASGSFDGCTASFRVQGR